MRRRLRASFEGAMPTMPVLKRLTILAVTMAAVLAAGGAAVAGLGQPSEWQFGLQQSVTPVMDNIVWFHDFLLYIITGITGFVLALLIIVMVRFNARANPTPSRTTHNTLVEVLWTIIPIVILLVIAVPSFKLLFLQLNTPSADLTVKATGKQWYWSYSYPDNGKFEFDSLMLKDAERKDGQPRLLAVDNDMVVPVNKTVRVITTGSDVIHSFAVPSFGIKIDAVPGRINETWFKATREGIYYGQCSELCGKDHAFMPIAVRVVSEQAFAAWVEEAKQKYARDEMAPPTNLAARNRGPSDADRRDVTASGARTNSRDSSHGSHGNSSRRGPSRPPARLAALPLFDQPQGHRYDVPGVRAGGRIGRRRPVDRDAARADAAGAAVLSRAPHVQRVHDRARTDHDFLHGHAGDDRRFRKLDGAADDRRAGHGVPAHEQHLVLAPAGLFHAVDHLGFRGGRAWRLGRRRRLDHLRAAVDHRSSGPRRRLRHPLAAPCRRLLDPRRNQFHHHDLQYARARHDAAQDAAIRLVAIGDGVSAVARHAGARRRHHHAADRP